jgi:leader peptidase (prepilin peptidase) / N-methyltransferase
MIETIIPAIFIFIIGAAFGSFFNVCIYRIPIKESIIFPNSHCPSCNYKIKPWHNIPIFSYLLLKGRCSNCSAKIHWHYFLVELITPIAFVSVFLIYGFSLVTIKYILFSSFGIIIIFIDSFHKIIPDKLSLPLLLIGLLFSFYQGIDISWKSAFIGSGTGFIFFLVIAYLFQLITKRESLGGGDIKLIAAIGSFTGLSGVAFTIFFSSFLALIILIPLGHDRQKEFPFGPFLIMGAFTYIFFGNKLFSLYLNLF